MKGQKHHIVESGGWYFRRRANQHRKAGWTRSMADATLWRDPGDAKRCAAQVDGKDGHPVCVCELSMVITSTLVTIQDHEPASPPVPGFS
ncbi:MAG: hypothetical protein AAFP15_16475, partial [Bacteroidota bacterium]